MKQYIARNLKNPIAWVIAVCIVAGAIVLGINMNVYANDAEATEPDTADVAMPNDILGRTTVANAAAMKKLGLFSWGLADTAPVKEEHLSGTPTCLDGLVLAIRIAGKEGEAFQGHYDTYGNVPAWAKYYSGYAIQQNLVGNGFAATDQMDAATYTQYLLWALNAQGIEAGKDTFAAFAGKAMDVGLMADMTYYALTLEAKDTISTTAEKLLAAGVINEKEAVLADLPVTANTEAAYQAYFATQLKEASEPFLYTEKNKRLMRQLMNDKTSTFAYIGKYSKLPADYRPNLETNLTLPSKSGNVAMEPYAYAQLKALFGGAKNDNIVIYTRSGYRSYATQKGLYGNGSNKYRAAPGTSEHQSGLAMDVVNKSNTLDDRQSSSREAQWLRNNAHEYGFIIRYPEGKESVTGYPPEWWHLRYVGKTVAYECKDKGITYDEFYNSCQPLEK